MDTVTLHPEVAAVFDMVPPTDESRTRCVAVLPDLGEVLEMLRTRGGLERRSR